MKRYAAWVILTAFLVEFCGCADMMPRWGYPGTAFEQRNRATIHDPYPDSQLGPGVEDVRPREYKDEEAEPKRSRAWRESGPRLGF